MSKNNSVAAPKPPVSIMPLTDFRGDPWNTGNQNAVAFAGGVMSQPVPADFAEKMKSEGKIA